MNVTRASFTRSCVPGFCSPALTALFIGDRRAIGGAFLWIFVIFSVVMNVAGYWLSDKFAIKGEPREAGVGAGGAAAATRSSRELAELVRAAEAARLHDPVRAAERVRHGP